MAGTTANLEFTTAAVSSPRPPIQNPLRVYSFVSLRFIVRSFFYHFRFCRRATTMTSYTNGTISDVISAKVDYKCSIRALESSSLHESRKWLCSSFWIFGYRYVVYIYIYWLTNWLQKQISKNLFIWFISSVCSIVLILKDTLWIR